MNIYAENDNAIVENAIPAIVITQANGTIAEASKTAFDLSGLSADDNIKVSELSFASLIELVTDAIFIADTSLNLIDTNFSTCKLFGHSKEAFLLLSLFDILDEQEFGTVHLEINSVIAGNTVKTERIFKRKDSTKLLMALDIKMIENGTILIIGHDITEQKKNEVTRNEINQRFEFVSKANSDAVWDWNLLTENFYWGDGFQTNFGYNLAEIKPAASNWMQLIHKEDHDRVIKDLYQWMNGAETHWVHEYRFCRADQTYAIVTEKGFIIRDSNGKAIRLVGAVQDITWRKKEEQHLKLLESVITNTTDAVLITEAEPFTQPGPMIVYVNDAFTKMTGYTAAEVIGATPRILQGPKTDKNELRKLSESLKKWETCEITVINYKKNGEEFWINMSISPVADEKGWFTHWISIERDVTERKNEDLQKKLLAAEISQLFNYPVPLNETLQEVLKRLAALGNFNIAEAWLIATDQQRINLVATLPETAEKQSFYNEGDEIKSFARHQGLPGITWTSGIVQFWQNLQDDDQFTRIDSAANTGLLNAYGIPILHNKQVIGAFVLGSNKAPHIADNLTAILENLGAYIGTEIKRKQLEQELNQIFSFAPDIIFTAGFDGYFKKINPAASRLLEYTEDELLAVPIAEFVHRDDVKKMTGEIVAFTAGNAANYFENRYITKSGQIKWLAWTLNLSFEEGLLFGVAKDITPKKSNEEKIRFHANLLTAVGQAVIATDIHGKVIYWNNAAMKIYGWSSEEVMGKNIAEFTITQQSDLEAAEIMNQLNEGKTWSGEFLALNKQGISFPAEVSHSIILNEQGILIGIIGVSTDITDRKRNELALQKNVKALENYKFALDESTIISITDQKGVITSINDNFCIISKYSRNELIGKTHSIFTSGYHPKAFFEELWFTISSGKVWRGEVKNSTKDGNYFWLYTTIIPFLNANNKPYRYLAIRFDITQKKIAEEAVLFTLHEKNTILESIGDAFFAVDKNWMVTYWNRIAEKALGKTKQEIIGKNFWDVFPESINSVSYKKYHQAIATGEVVHFEDFTVPLGKWHELSAYPSGEGLSVYFKDVTERKLIEIRLIELNKNLQRQTKELALSNEELEQFAYVASHDLQEPLRMVTSFLSKLEKKYGSIIDDKGKKYIGFAVDGSKRMRQIILDLLEFSRIGRLEYNQESIDLNELIEEIKILFRNQVKEKAAIIQVNKLLPIVNAYKAPLRQVFQNLISNALKYTGSGVIPLIQIEAEESDKHWKFSIKDNGIGISDEYFDKIFIIFQRLHNKDDYSGTGIGLAVTKKIIEKQGGTIWVESEEGVGSTFHFTFAK